MEEEYALSVRPGDDTRPRVAESDGAVASRCHEVSPCGVTKYLAFCRKF